MNNEQPPSFNAIAKPVPRALKSPVEIATHRWEAIPCVEVVVTKHLRTGDIIHGRGEGTALFYRPETAEGLAQQINELAPHLTGSITRRDLLGLLPANGARCALDAALWSLETAESGVAAWQRAGLSALEPVLTAATVYLDTPARMAESAAQLAPHFPLIKVKLGASGDEERIRAVRSAAPDAQLIVDANAGWSTDDLDAMTSALVDSCVTLVEQPLAPEHDAALDGYDGPLRLCADESFQTIEDVERCRGRYQVLNIKLDKCGGLTSALAIADLAKVMGFDLMVGNMLGSSLGMAPAHLFAQLCILADLDGPLSLASDVTPAMTYAEGKALPPPTELWG
ncbi:MAG: dipeptide epimerase [Pseudomonadota bacterium]